MASFQHYEDLRSVFARLNQVLPGRPRAQDGAGEEGWDWRNTVIEAKPARVERLNIAGGVFKGGIPSAHQTSPGRRWHVAERTQVCTSAEETTGLAAALPPGVSLWHASDQARRLMVLAMHDAKAFFDEQTMECTLPAHDEWRTRGSLALFATPGPAELCFRDSMRLLQPKAPYLARLAQEYARSIAWMFGMRRAEFEEACRLHITWRAKTGIEPVRLPPASPCRYENGPIVRVGLGRPVVAHDLIPALPELSSQEHAVRVEVGEGVMVCTDGPARMRYSHGHPSAQGKGGDWFTLTYFLDCTRQSVAVGYDRETRALVMATPVRRDRVVAAHPPENMPSKSSSGLGLDLMGVLVKDMRLRLRVAESHVLASRYEGTAGKGEPTGLNSSSSMSLE